MSPPVFRFAPSPNGYLHLGHALSAFINADMRARGPAGGCCCGSRISTPRAAVRNSRARSTRISPGSGCNGKSRCGGNPSISTDYRRALDKLEAQGLVYPSFESRAEIDKLVARARSRRRLAARSGRRAALSGQPARRCRRPSAKRGWRPASLTRCGSTWRRRSRASATLTLARGRGGLDRSPIPPPGAMWCWRARTCRRAITSRWWSTTRCKA